MATEAEAAGATSRGGITGSIGTGVATAGDITDVGVLDLMHASADELERITNLGLAGCWLSRADLGRLARHSSGTPRTTGALSLAPGRCIAPTEEGWCACPANFLEVLQPDPNNHY